MLVMMPRSGRTASDRSRISTGAAHTHLDHGRLMGAAECKQCYGSPISIVSGCPCFSGSESGKPNRRGESLVVVLPRCRDADDLQFKTAAVQPSDANSAFRVSSTYRTDRRTRRACGPRRKKPPGQRVVDIFVSIEVFPPRSPQINPPHDLPGVGAESDRPTIPQPRPGNSAPSALAISLTAMLSI
jgi:hypothetical protein